MNFTGIQNSHMVGATNYQQSAIRTGYEYLVTAKTGSTFAMIAKDDGVVKDITKTRIVVEYKDGTTETYNIGDVHTTHEGVVYRNELVTNLTKGEKFKKNYPIYYHDGFFEPDWLDKSRLVYKQNRTCNVAISSATETYEDSNAISYELAQTMKTIVLKERKYTLSFDTNIDKLVNVGDEVLPNTTLFIDTGDTDNANNLSELSLSLLDTISSISPRAKYKGVVDRIEVKYNGDIDDMSPTLKKLVNRLNAATYERTKGTSYEAKDNKVSGEYASDGKKLTLDTLELKIFIRVEIPMGVGNKLVVGNNAKSVTGKVINHPLVGAVTGTKVDVQMSLSTFIYRVTVSPFLAGTANRLIDGVSKQVADIYFGK